MLNSWSCAIYVLFIVFGVCSAQETCYPPGGVAGIVVATIIVTFVVGALGAAVAYKLWTRKTGEWFVYNRALGLSVLAFKICMLV